MSIINIRTARALLAPAVALTAAASPAPASASSVDIRFVNQPNAGIVPTLVVLGGGVRGASGAFNESNRIQIEDVAGSPNTFMVRDLGSGTSPFSLVAGQNCRQQTATVAVCSGAGVGDTRHYFVELNAGNDQLTVRSTHLASGGQVLLGDGDDAYFSPVRARDRIVGGAGRDTLSYAGRQAAGGVLINSLDSAGEFIEGEANEDSIAADVEQVTGTNAADTMVVPSELPSGRVPHGLLSGADGDDVLGGSAFGDLLNGGAGVDHLNGRAGDDTLEARENTAAGQTVARDDVRCGPGSDVVVADLQDAVSFDCETISRAAVDEGGILGIVARAARVRRGSVAVQLHCPSDSKTRCDGRLTLSRRGRKLGSATYEIAKGRRATVRIPVPAATRGKVTATAVEPDSKRRPKTTIAPLTVR